MNQMLDVLLRADDPNRCEWPANFDRPAAIKRVEALLPEIERIVGGALQLDTNIEDASYFAEASLQKTGERANYIEFLFAIRFSSFGNLFTIWSSERSHGLPAFNLEELLSAAKENGFVYVDIETLKGPYSGSNESCHAATWWDRFFAYF